MKTAIILLTAVTLATCDIFNDGGDDCDESNPCPEGAPCGQLGSDHTFCCENCEDCEFGYDVVEHFLYFCEGTWVVR